MTIRATGLSGIRAGRIILHPTDLEIRASERVGLVGPSGSGKSTLGHALVDRLRQQGRGVSHVPQSPDEGLDPLRSMAFHWREAARAIGVLPDPAQQQALFSALGISGGNMRDRPWGWSRGMQQRFVIAMALIGRPELLVMDEPTSALDPVVAADTMDLLEGYLATRSTALLLITHDLGLAARRVARLMVMDQGRIIEDAATAHFLTAPETHVGKMLCGHRNWRAFPC
ncbi:ATP-binding cassette domain-containing protein [Phaeobacter sp. B1627]|uniref:ATP-binding cassette domain-containing protein n=1 Tax=Phaeobacter sp. B1627 TaxID=2583809 RepID=UPI00111AB5A8|nr:ATP-binding cassette domain-containing protein [Phaeobacter sp. B1627]TNJ40550.1 ATP-binding cassette domain-containing protein [Phaeobacter sp. B1627]